MLKICGLTKSVIDILFCTIFELFYFIFNTFYSFSVNLFTTTAHTADGHVNCCLHFSLKKRMIFSKYKIEMRELL